MKMAWLKKDNLSEDSGFETDFRSIAPANLPHPILWQIPSALWTVYSLGFSLSMSYWEAPLDE